MNKTLLLLMVSLPLCAMENQIVRINDSHVQSSSDMSMVSVYHDPSGFSVVVDGQIHAIPHHNLNAPLRDINQARLSALLDSAYLRVKRYDNGEFALDANGRIHGGGPIVAAIGYGIVKAAGWAFVGAAASKTMDGLSKGDNPTKATVSGAAKTAGTYQVAAGTTVPLSPTMTVTTGGVGTYAGTRAADKMGKHDSALACVAVGAGVGVAIENAALAVYAWLLPLPTP